MRTAILVVLALVLAGCGGPGDDEPPQVRFETSLGDFTVELWPDKAPVTVENFLRYVDEGFYDGLTFHRVGPGFVVQGGGFEPDGTRRDTHDPIVNEADKDVKNEQWTLSMARTREPDSATSQFFINLAANPALDKTPGSAGYAVFGKVISGFGTIEAMTQVEPGQKLDASTFAPAEPIVIQQATIIKGSAPEPLPPPPPAKISGDLITPGAWRITNTHDTVLGWARNSGGQPANATFSVTGPDGGALPDGWNVTIDEPTARVGGGKAAHALVHVMVPNGTSGTFDLELRTGHSTTPITADVELVHDRVSQVGDSITAQYAGTCKADGTAFDDGQFPLELGAGGAIVGFDLGLVGLGLDEEARLVLPAPMAYGEKGGPCADKENADLVFDVQIVSFDD